MSRQLEAKTEERRAKRDERLVKALEFELDGAIAHLGGKLTGIAITIDEHSCLFTLKVSFEDKRMVAHVGEETLSDCLLKCIRQAYMNSLVWSKDKWPRKIARQ